jgi:hypothetical protein
VKAKCQKYNNNALNIVKGRQEEHKPKTAFSAISLFTINKMLIPIKLKGSVLTTIK